MHLTDVLGFLTFLGYFEYVEYEKRCSQGESYTIDTLFCHLQFGPVGKNVDILDDGSCFHCINFVIYVQDYSIFRGNPCYTMLQQ